MPRSLQVCRVWDALFSEGSKILFRTALAVLKAQEDALLAYDNAGAPLQFSQPSQGTDPVERPALVCSLRNWCSPKPRVASITYYQHQTCLGPSPCMHCSL